VKLTRISRSHSRIGRCCPYNESVKSR